MRASSALRGGVAAIAIATAALPSGYAASAPAGLQVRVGQADRFSRVEFAGLGAPKASLNGQVLTLTFARDAQPDMTVLGLAPPRFVTSAAAAHDKGRLSIALTLDDNTDYKVGQADGATYVNIFAKGGPVPAADAPVTPVAAAPAPTTPVVSGPLKVAAKSGAGQTQLSFNWPSPAAAAVFRRGEAVFVIFDQPAKLDISGLPATSPQYSKIDVLGGPGWSGLRIAAPDGVVPGATAQDNSWQITLGKSAPAAPTAITAARDVAAASATLTAQEAGARAPIVLQDPAVGDKLLVIPALGPAKAVTARRDFAELSLLQTAQGLAVEPHVSDLMASTDGQLVKLGRPSGLTLSGLAAAAQADAAGNAGPQAADAPGLFSADWIAPSGEFIPRYDALMTAAAMEGDEDPDGPTAAHMALARFLIGNDLDYEAIGVLDRTQKMHPKLAASSEFLGLRGMAKAMVGRFKEAEVDLSGAALAGDPAAAMWRAYGAVQDRRYDDAKKLFASGANAEPMFPALWRARFARAQAEMALATGDYATAQAAIMRALAQDTPPSEQIKARLQQARLMQATNDPRALAVFQAVAKAPDDSVAAPAMMYATGLQLAAGKITVPEAASTYDQLRFRWRGDSTELNVIRTLGQLYISQGQYRQALETYVTAKDITPDDPVAVQIQNDAAGAFRTLFLDGAADGLQPIEALGLFQDFQQYTPIGPDGDLMLRKMVGRLVDVDLLPQAATYLKYQIDNRLDGVAKAQVSSQLATIYLMNHQPEQALGAINDSRTTVLPMAMNIQRRELSARAMVELGRTDAAADLLQGDNSPDAQDIRADIAWRTQSWSAAGPLFEKRLGDRWKNPAPLSPAEEGELLRAGAAFTLAGDNASIARLRTRYGSFFDKAANPETLKVIFTDGEPGAMSMKDFAKATADDAVFQGWVDKMKQQMSSPPVKAANQQAAAGATGKA